tara:strand:+ start:521 stop:676 length:156 start_codon:yes stop_codon:yes gene_type:complete
MYLIVRNMKNPPINDIAIGNPTSAIKVKYSVIVLPSISYDKTTSITGDTVF